MTLLLRDGFEHRFASATAAEYGGADKAASLNTIGFDTSDPRSGEACLSCGPSAANLLSYSHSGVLDRTYYWKFAFKHTGTPSGQGVIAEIRAGATICASLRMSGGRALTWYDVTPANTSQPNVTLTAGQWYVIEVKYVIPTAGNGTLSMRIDGSPAGSLTDYSFNFGNTAHLSLRIGHIGGAETGVTCYFDDFGFNDDQGSSDNSWIGLTKIDWAWWTADSAIGNWLRGGGSSTNVGSDTDQRPPAGAATAADGTQAKTNTTNATSSLDISVEDYTTLGLSASDKVIGVRTVVRAAGSSSSGTNNGSSRVVSNPASSGDTSHSALFDNVAGADASPTVWRTVACDWLRDANGLSVTKGTDPVIRATKATSSTRIHYIDQLALEVEWLVYTDVTPPVPNLVSESRVKISSVSGADTSVVTWTSDEAFTSYMLRVVPSASSTYTEGTLIEQDQNPAAGGDANTEYQSTITDDELIAASPGDGAKIVKLFTKDAANNWST